MLRSLLAVMGLATCLWGQAATGIKGVVKDPQGGTVSKAQMRLYRQPSGAVLRTATSETGEFRFDKIAPGSFLLEIDRENFRSQTLPLDLNVGSVREIDVTLDIEGVGQTVVVTASGVPQTLDESSKALTVITRDEIENRNEYAFSEILRTSPGVLITNGGGPGQNTNIRIRGLRADATSILIDGLRFRDASTLQADASSMISTLNFIDASRVEVLRGSGSSLYGTNAVGGVVNIVTQEGGSPLHGKIQVEGGNLGLFRGRGSIGGGALGDRLKYSAGLLHLNITQGVDGQDTNRSTGGQGFLRYDLTPSLSVSGRIWASDDFVQLNVSPGTSGIAPANLPATGAIPARPGTTFTPGRNDPDYRRSSRFASSAFVLRHALAARFSWQTSYQRLHTNRVLQNGPLGPGFQPIAADRSEYAGDIDTADVRGIAQIAPWLQVTGGYEFERERYFDQQRNNLPAPQTLAVENRLKQDSHAGYFAAQAGLLERRLQISFSGRAQVFRLARPDFRFAGLGNPYEAVRLESPRRALTGDVSVAYLLKGANTKLRVHGGNAYRAPALYERFGAGFYADPVSQTVLFTPYGDPRLVSDRYNSIDAGIDQYLIGDRLRISATYFYTRIVSLSGFDFSGLLRPSTDPYGRSSGYINGAGGISRGFEFGLEARPMRTLVVSGSYTYTRANLDKDLSVTGVYSVLGSPRHTTTLVATKNWTRRIDTTLELFKGASYLTPFFAVDRSRVFTFPGFSKTDVVASYRFLERENGALRVYGKVDNIFNRRYYQGGWLAPGATFVIGLGFGS